MTTEIKGLMVRAWWIGSDGGTYWQDFTTDGSLFEIDGAPQKFIGGIQEHVDRVAVDMEKETVQAAMAEKMASNSPLN